MFYKIRDSNKYPLVNLDFDFIKISTITCPIQAGHKRPSGRMLNPLTVIIKSHRIGDFNWTWFGDCVLTDKVAGIFKEEGFTGYELAPVTVSKMKVRENSDFRPPRLWELKVHGWGGMAPEESGVRLLEECKECGLLEYSDFEYASKLIDEKLWDGSDFFMVWPLPRYFFVTERVREVIINHKLTGCTLIPYTELPNKYEKKLLGTISPGRLRRWMPEDRAHKLGDPLGIY